MEVHKNAKKRFPKDFKHYISNSNVALDTGDM